MKNIEKTDIRIVHTKAKIFNALDKLLKEKPFSKITVIDICEKAHVNRMTFYNHYDDKYDLLDESIQLFLKYLDNTYTSKTSALNIEMKTSPYECFKIIAEILVDYVYDNEKVIYNLTSNQEDEIATFMIKRAIYDSALKIVTDSDVEGVNGFPISLIISFFAGGASSLFAYWLGNISSISKEVFTSYLCRIIKAVIDTEVLKQL